VPVHLGRLVARRDRRLLRSISARSRLDRPATEIMLIDVTRRRAADLGTRQV
jgi:hypothetical protein